MTDATRRTIRTVVQTTVALAVPLPATVDASGISASPPWVAGSLAVAGGLAHVMVLPGMQALLPGWPRAEPPRLIRGVPGRLGVRHRSGPGGTVSAPTPPFRAI